MAAGLGVALGGDLEVLYTLGNQLANSRAWPNWSKDESFRAVRDASADQRK